MTAVVERTGKFQFKLNPRSGADVWLIAPVDDQGNRVCADLHLDVDSAEEAAFALLQAVDDIRCGENNEQN